jgi:hypothetical protein
MKLPIGERFGGVIMPQLTDEEYTALDEKMYAAGRDIP